MSDSVQTEGAGGSGATGGGPGRLDTALAYMIHRTARLLRYHLLGFFRELGLDITPEQWFILYRLYEQDGRSQSELTDRAIDDRANITRLVDSLEKRGFVVRNPDPDDRRRALVTLTGEGRLLLGKVLPLVTLERDRLFGHLGEDEAALRRMLEDLQQRLPGAE